MAIDSRTIKAICLCGNAAHDITAPASDFPFKAYFCHCNSCRHYTGTLCFTVAFVPTPYTPSPSLISMLQAYQFSKRMIFYFCPTCGSKIIARCLKNGDDPDSDIAWGIPTGTLEEADGVFDVKGHEHIQDTHDGGLADFISTIDGKHVERWPGDFQAGKEIPLPWSSPSREHTIVSAETRLHAHCHCKSINFYIARPSDRSSLAKVPPFRVSSTHSQNQPLPSEKEIWWLRSNRSKYLVSTCACDSCRLASGVEWMQWAYIPTADMSLDPDGQVPLSLNFATLKGYHSTPGPNGATRYFCGKCGAVVFWDGWDGENKPKLKDVAVGLFDTPEGARAESWLQWETERVVHRNDAVVRAKSLTLAMEHGLREYGERMQLKTLK